MYLNLDNDLSVSGVYPRDFLKEYQRRTNNQTLFAGFKAGQGYDSVWAIAMALNES